MIPLIWGTENNYTPRGRNEHGGWQGQREGRMGSCLISTEFQFCKIKGVLDMDGGDDCTIDCIQCH